MSTGHITILVDNCARRRGLRDDQALLVRTAAGMVVVLGCAHAGVINTVRFVRTLHPGAYDVRQHGG